MKHGVFFFFFLTPLFSVLCLGPGAVRMSWPPGRGLGCWFSLLLRGPGWSSCPRAGAKGVQLRDRALTTPLGVVVPGSRSIECIWGVWVWVPCPFCVSTCGARVCIFVCVHEGGNVCLCIWVLVRLRLCVRSGLRLHLTHHLSRPPPHHHALPVEDCRRCVGGFSRRGGMLGWAPAHSRRSLGGAWPYWPCWAPIGGWGPLVSGPRARSAWCGRLPVELRACRHGTLGRLHCGCRRSHLRALLCPFLGGGCGCPCGGSPGGPVSWGAPGCLGPGSFPCLLHALRMGLLFPTHTIKHLHGGTLWTQARSHTQVYTQAFTLVVKTGAHRHTLSWSAVASNLFCNIS